MDIYYSYEKVVDPESLHAQIEEVFEHFLYVETVGEGEESVVNLYFSQYLEGEQTEVLDSIVNGHNLPGPSISEIIDASLANAEKEGKRLIQKFKKENVLSGITQMNKTKEVSDYLHWMNHYLEQGSLYAAIQQVDIYIQDQNRANLQLEPFVTDEVLTGYKHELQDYLNIPRT